MSNGLGPVRDAAALTGYDGPLLLDTHVWLWLLEGDTGRIAPALRELLERSGARGALRVLDISYWEVAVKTARGKLSLSIDASVWFRRAERAPGIAFLPLDRDVLLLATRLSDALHNDPADRMLIAAALLHDLPLVTADARLIEYATSHQAPQVVDARS
ncbi:MAG TPA: type II toxin-antitoxin system VapC family toxin [Longimicrobiales bacterium]